ncbi:MAG: transcription termination factor NusA [Proteobacteria bacterium]|jgi:N utilization substance protein A|nr:transcription termination factor NusA [Pseudomonadota bacterium]
MADNMFSELSRVIEQVGKDKGIDRNLVIDAITQAMLVAARKKYGTYREIEASYNEDTGEVELFEFKEVVDREKFIDDEVEIPLDEALKLDPGAQLDDSIGIKLDSRDLGRIAAQTAKQIILQKVRDAEREIIYNEFEQRKGEIASGIARRVERGAIVVDMGRTEAYIPPREQIPGESYKPGDRIQGYLSEVRQTTRGPQIIMSRADERYLMKLFEMEVPEIYDGIVEIMAAAREPGQRAKIAVKSKDQAVDPVGACVGMKGTRVQNIVQELRGEKIDIVPWDEDIARFAANALAPAEISRIFLDEENKELEIVVPDSQLSLAIGKRGQNVRLAAKLTGWKIDILSESAASARTAEAIFNLMLIPGMTETMAQNIFQSGFGTFTAVAQAKLEDLMTVPGYDDPAKAEKLIKDAQAIVDKYQAEGIPVPQSPQAQAVAAAKATSSDAKAQADLRLKQELEKLGSKTEEQ